MVRTLDQLKAAGYRIACITNNVPTGHGAGLARSEDRSDALEQAITATRQFAKRQMTWFRNRMPHYIWYDPLQSNIIAQFGQISA
jgi:tRNA A37 N6-isopentenylltransferase MiaA